MHRPNGTVFLVRHAPTASNIGKVFMGQLDVPALPVEAPERFQVPRVGDRTIYTSPLERARATATLLFPDEIALVDERLSERAVGEWQGLNHDAVRARWPWAFTGGKVNPLADPPGGETLDELSRRVGSFLTMLAERQGSSDVYVVTHNGWIRMALYLNGDIAFEKLFAEPVPFLQPTAFDLRPGRLPEQGPIPGSG